MSSSEQSTPSAQQVDHALAVIEKAPPAAFIAEHSRVARFSAALALVAQAVTLFDELRGSGDQKALEAAGRLGDGNLIGDAWDAGEDLRDNLARWSRSLKGDAYSAVRKEALDNFRDAIAGTDDKCIEHYLKVAVALEAEWPTRCRD